MHNTCPRAIDDRVKMTNEHDQQPAPRFSLASLIEFIAGVAIFLALVTQMGWDGFYVAFAALLVISTVVLARDRKEAQGHVKILGVFFTLILIVMCLATATSDRIWPNLWLILLTLVFVAFSVMRRLPLLKRTSTGGGAPDA